MINYEVQAKFTKETDGGFLKRVKEWFILTAAVSFTDAEAIVNAEVGSTVRGEFSIEQIKKVEYEDIFETNSGDPFWKCRMSYKTEDADTGKEKKLNKTFLVQAPDVDTATAELHDGLKGIFHKYEIESVVKTQIVDKIDSKVVKKELEEAPAEA